MLKIELQKEKSTEDIIRRMRGKIWFKNRVKGINKLM